MPEPLDLTGRYGEGWCVTVTRGEPLEALSGMEVDPAETRPAPTLAAAAGLTWDSPGVLLVARQIADDVSLVLEVDGSTGWVGTRPDVLAVLSAGGGMACSISKNPNREELLHAVDAVLVTGLDPATFRRWGSDPERFSAALAAAGFPGPDGEDGADEILRLSAAQRAVTALGVLTGVELSASMFDGPWIAGPSTR
jgi:hypothetical protein